MSTAFFSRTIKSEEFDPVFAFPLAEAKEECTQFVRLNFGRKSRKTKKLLQIFHRAFEINCYENGEIG